MDFSEGDILMDDEGGSQNTLSDHQKMLAMAMGQMREYPTSDASSVLSDPPPEMNLETAFDRSADLDMAQHEAWDMDATVSSHQAPQLRRPRLTIREADDVVLQDSDSNSDDCSDESYDGESASIDGTQSDTKPLPKIPFEKLYRLKIVSAVSSFEKVPTEVLAKIASFLPSDSDLSSLIQTCHTFARQLQPENSEIWKTRFLQKYDHPLVQGPYEYRVAYQLRAIALPRFEDITFETRAKARLLLGILRDMILETYNKPHSWSKTPKISRNMRLFSNSMNADWMIHFLSTRHFARDNSHPYGRHRYKLFDTLQVVFSYLLLNRSGTSFEVTSDRKDYDLAQVYRWEEPFNLLYERLPDREPKERQRPQSALFPNLQARTPPPKLRFKLNMNALLHIRNFWHRHLIGIKEMGGESTYAEMLTVLAENNLVPKAWTRPLQEPLKIPTRWFGHYSCLYPWPKTRRQLTQKESEAELWEYAEPLVMQLTTNHYPPAVAWPPIFSTIPAFTKAIDPALLHPSAGTLFLRGLVPFASPYHITHRIPQWTLTPRREHPFTRLRLRGLIHPLRPQSGIPGFGRAVFVLYKPTNRYLSNLFDHATEFFGEPFEAAMAAADITGSEEIDAHYAQRLEYELRRLRGPLEMSTKAIEDMEDRFMDPRALDWEDIEAAYAYEGVVTPGGMVMMGRWWRVGPPGEFALGDACEYLYAGLPAGRERGPFVFWAG